jgi:50S ribosome-binding GTPase
MSTYPNTLAVPPCIANPQDFELIENRRNKSANPLSGSVSAQSTQSHHRCDPGRRGRILQRLFSLIFFRVFHDCKSTKIVYEFLSTFSTLSTVKFYQNTMLRLNLSLINLHLRRFSSSRPSRKTIEEAHEKSIKVAIIGMPNSGKSTFINTIMDLRVRKKVNFIKTSSHCDSILGLCNI